MAKLLVPVSKRAIEIGAAVVHHPRVLFEVSVPEEIAEELPERGVIDTAQHPQLKRHLSLVFPHSWDVHKHVARGPIDQDELARLGESNPLFDIRELVVRIHFVRPIFHLGAADLQEGEELGHGDILAMMAEEVRVGIVRVTAESIYAEGSRGEMRRLITKLAREGWASLLIIFPDSTTDKDPNETIIEWRVQSTQRRFEQIVADVGMVDVLGVERAVREAFTFPRIYPPPVSTKRTPIVHVFDES